MICEKDKKKLKDSETQLHHLFPKEFGGTDKEGRIWLCKKHHGQLHDLINSLGLKSKEEILEFTNRWLLEKEDSKRYCPKCKDEKADMPVFIVKSKSVILKCRYCGYEEECKDAFVPFLDKKLNEDENGKRGTD